MEKLNKTEPQIRSRAHLLKLKQDKTSEFFKDWQRRAAAGKVGKKRPDQSIRFKQWLKDGTIQRHDPTTHGNSKSPYYHIWANMHYRCYSKRSSDYKNYGKRGIRVCEDWHDISKFIKWCEANQRPSTAHTLDRIDNDGDYSPDNCRWSTAKQQSRNRRTNVLTEETVKMIHTLYTEVGNQREVARRVGIDYRTVNSVLKGHTWGDISR